MTRNSIARPMRQRVLGGSKIPVTGATREALGKLDAGAWFAAEFRGTPIPTLAEALGVIQAESVTLIERKSGDPETCIALLTSKGYLPRVVVQSFDWEFVGQCHRQAPDLVLAALGSKELTAEKLEQIAGCGAAIVGWNEQDLQPGDVDRIHQRGWKLWVYTVNDVARAKELAALGIDGIITDDPAAMLAALQPWRSKIVVFRSAKETFVHWQAVVLLPRPCHDRSAASQCSYVVLQAVVECGEALADRRVYGIERSTR